MDEIKDFFSIENITQLIESYSSFGVVVGFVWPFLNSFVTIVPLVLIVTINANAFGFWDGFFISFIGSTSGTIGMFFLVRNFGRKFVRKYFFYFDKNHRLMKWVDSMGFGPLFLFFALPFTPSLLTNIFAGISHVKVSSYLPAATLGNFILILTVSFLGKDIFSYSAHPFKILILLGVLVLLWKVGKLVEFHLNKKHEQSTEVN